MRENSSALLALTKHTAFQTVFFHLAPGLIQLFIMVLLIPLSLRLGFAGMEGQFAGNLTDVFALMPLQIGFLLFVSKKATGTYCIFKLISFQEKSKFWEYLIFIVVMTAWALLIDAVLSPFENGLRDTLFRFVPDHIAMRDADYTVLTKSKRIVAACFCIFANGVVAPFTEEIYFRGYLLPRIHLSPGLAVLVSAVLFSAYHFFSPWYFFSRILMTLPIYYLVIKRMNMRFSLIAHMIANIYTGVSLLLSVI